MTINLQTGGYQAPQVLPGARSADIQVASNNQPVQQQEYVDPFDTAPNAEQAAISAEQQRYERVAAAAQKVAGDPYPISDKSFTIFKDASGQYVTRYTSLRDGRVTYVPELKVLQQFEAQQASLKASLKLKV